MTIAKIAESAGVSVSTVSKVLNGRADVSPATRSRVEELISEQGYRRRRSSKRTSSPTIDLVFHELDSAWSIEIIRGVEQAARAAGLRVVLSSSGGQQSPEDAWIGSVLAHRSTAAILVLSNLSPEQHEQLATRGIPFVVIDPNGDPGDGVPSVGATNWNGGLAATRHLIALGHERISVIGGPKQFLCSRARVDGFRSALESAGLEADPALVQEGDFSVGSGHDRAEELLSIEDPPTAIFAGNDLQAMGVYEAARESGVRIPEDLSVVGFDDLPTARWVGPPLTTVRQPLVEMAEEATRLALSLSRGERPANLRLDLATDLVVRQSTAVPRSG
ncbi:LacI family DNA-binding transcriptional regulator [Nocardiopsis salina]|uniref:LacI family DNA-binding transcriptional regulator n=1 Tax=Nocardiopsis salina TaxID=245836 RepID=UPI000A061B28|nr:LacI family DNA-binding transcriptional regulator [Nocardiopsis salina]